MRDDDDPGCCGVRSASRDEEVCKRKRVEEYRLELQEKVDKLERDLERVRSKSDSMLFVPTPPKDDLTGYVYMWCLHRLYETVGGGNQTLGWSAAEQASICLMTVAAGATRSVRLLCATMAVVMVSDLIKAPFIWDSEWWCLQTDLAFILSATLEDGFFSSTIAVQPEARQRIFARAAATIRIQMTIFYSAAAFWKLNTAFLDSHSSCAPIFVVQLVDAFWPRPSLPRSVLRGLVKIAPLATLLLEGGIAFGLATRRARLGLSLALFLHLGIALCPPPNNVATFSLMCASRLVAFVPRGFSEALNPRKSWSVAGFSVAIAGVAFSWPRANHPGFFDLALPLFVAVVPLLALAIRRQEIPPPNSFKHRGRRTLVALAFFYAFLVIPLGLQDQGQPHMYANLKLHGGSNHFFAPTGLAQRLFERRPWSSIGGGIVRIERSDSAVFNDINPGEYSHELTDRSRRWLEAGGHTGRMWNPMLTAVTSSEAPWDPKKPFTKYTLPSHEFRRLLASARAREERFSLEYTQLFGVGSESWRANSPGRTVRISSKRYGGESCTVLKPRRRKCAESDLPNLPEMSWWANKFMLFEAYPIVPGDQREVHCFGP